jgi:hypothetical protein
LKPIVVPPIVTLPSHVEDPVRVSVEFDVAPNEDVVAQVPKHVDGIVVPEAVVVTTLDELVEPDKAVVVAVDAGALVELEVDTGDPVADDVDVGALVTDEVDVGALVTADVDDEVETVADDVEVGELVTVEVDVGALVVVVVTVVEVVVHVGAVELH